MGIEGLPNIKRANIPRFAPELEEDYDNRNNITNVTVPIGKVDKSPAVPTTPADEVRSDLGVSLSGTKAEEVVEDQSTQVTTETPEVVEEQPVQGEVKTNEVVVDAPKAEETPAQPAHIEPITEEQVQERIMFDEDETLTTARKYATKDARKAAVADLEKQFMENGLADGTAVTDKKQARKLAENYVKNEQNLEGFYSTKTYLTKDEYKAAQKANKQAKKDYYNDLRSQGMGRREARKKANEWADANLVHNKRLKNKEALAYFTNSENGYLNEDGSLNQVKYKQFCEGLMNTHTQEGEVRNGHLSLKESREAEKTQPLSAKALRDTNRSAGGNTEGDYTTVKQIAIIGGTTAVVAAAGALLAPAITVGAGAASSAAAGATAGAAGAGAASGATAAAAAGAGVTISGYGAAAGVVPLTLGGYLKDKLRDNGGVEPRVYAPAQPKPEPVIEEEQDDEPEVCTLVPDEHHEVVQEEVNYCSHTVTKGDDWMRVAQAKYKVQTGTDAQGNPITRPVTPQEALKIAHELKMAHGIARKDFNKCIFPKVGEELRLYNEFDGLYHPELAGVKFIVDCDAQVQPGRITGPMRGRYQQWGGQYNGAVRDHNIDQYWYTDCSNNRSNIFATRPERDADMARRQAEINAGK